MMNMGKYDKPIVYIVCCGLLMLMIWCYDDMILHCKVQSFQPHRLQQQCHIIILWTVMIYCRIAPLPSSCGHHHRHHHHHHHLEDSNDILPHCPPTIIMWTSSSSSSSSSSSCGQQWYTAALPPHQKSNQEQPQPPDGPIDLHRHHRQHCYQQVKNVSPKTLWLW